MIPRRMRLGRSSLRTPSGGTRTYFFRRIYTWISCISVLSLPRNVDIRPRSHTSNLRARVSRRDSGPSAEYCRRPFLRVEAGPRGLDSSVSLVSPPHRSVSRAIDCALKPYRTTPRTWITASPLTHLVPRPTLPPQHQFPLFRPCPGHCLT